MSSHSESRRSQEESSFSGSESEASEGQVEVQLDEVDIEACYEKVKGEAIEGGDQGHGKGGKKLGFFPSLFEFCWDTQWAEVG